MKKFLFTLLLSLIYCSFANANIIFKDCSLEPNYGSDAVFTIDLDKQTIKVNDTYELEKRVRNFDIQKFYGNIITSSNIKNSSDTPLGGLEFLTQYIIDEVLFDLEKKTVTANFTKKTNISEGLSNMLDIKEKVGKLKWNVSSACKVDNPYKMIPVEEEPEVATEPVEEEPEVASEPVGEEPDMAAKPIDESELIIIGSGSGFFISSQGHIVSNAHVVGGCKKIKVYENGKEILLNILDTDTKNDVGLVKGKFKNTKYLNIKSDGAELGEDIVAFGYPLVDTLSDSVKLTKGIVSALAGPNNNFAMIQIDAALQPGNSGGPVLNMNGLVVGIATSGLSKLKMAKEQKILPENVNFAVAAPTIVKFLKANNINVPQGTNKIYKTKELAKIGGPATVQLLCLNTMEAYEKLLNEEDYSQVLLDLK